MSPRRTGATEDVLRHQIADGEATREDELLADFESRKQRGERFSIAEFCQQHDYASAKGIRRFSRLRVALHTYCRAGARDHVQLPDRIAALHRDLAAREAEVVRLRDRLSVVTELEMRLEIVEAARVQATFEAGQLRAMVTALVFQIAPRSVKRAAMIERTLLEVAQSLVPGLPDAVPEDHQAILDPRVLAIVRSNP